MSIRSHLNQILKSLEHTFHTHNLIEISKSAIHHNLNHFAKLSNHQQIIPTLKSDAYGHGLIQVAQILSDYQGPHQIPYLAVDGYFEALKIRDISNLPVLIMGKISPNNLSQIKYQDFTFVVDDQEAVSTFGKTNKKIKIHLEINTGMNRYGCKEKELPAILATIKKYPNLNLEGVMTHLADADGENIATVQKAVTIYDNCIDKIKKAGFNPTSFHIANSAGALKVQSNYANAMRLGIGLYGINPFSKSDPLSHKLTNLKPALQLKSQITKIIELEPGDQVSYNYTFTAQKPTKIAILPLGYYEGLDRQLSNQGVVKIDEKYASIVGKICMNHTMIDITSIETAKVGTLVIIYGNQPDDLNSIQNICKKFNLFPYSLLINLNSTVRRAITN